MQTEVVDSLQKLAAGDLTFEVTPRDDQDILRGSLKQLETDLNDLMAQIQTAGRKITLASGQVADSSQTLSQGATEQAASLETKAAADKGSAQMQTMVAAMSDITKPVKIFLKLLKLLMRLPSRPIFWLLMLPLKQHALGNTEKVLLLLPRKFVIWQHVVPKLPQRQQI